MSIRVQAFRYELPFREPVRTGLLTTTSRHGLLLCADTPQGRVWSEAAPLDGYGMDTLDDALRALPAALDALQRCLPDLLAPDSDLSSDRSVVPAMDLPPSLAWAADILALKIQALQAGVPLAVRLGGEATGVVRSSALEGGPTVATPAAAKPHVVKLKVGAGPVEEDISRVLAYGRFRSDLHSESESNARTVIRLDANRAWTLSEALAFVEGISAVSGQLDFLEEPLAEAADWEALAQRAGQLGIALAADESLRDVNPDWSAAARLAQVHVFKPSLHGSWRRLRDDVHAAKSAGMRVVFSSSFETGIGMADLVHVTAALSNDPLSGKPMPDEYAGFGTHAWLAADLVAARANARLREPVIAVAGISSFEQPVAVCPVRMAAHTNPDGIAVVDADGTRLTWAQLDVLVEQACRHPGLKPGVRLDVRADQSVAFVILLFAAMRRGAWLHPMNPHATGKAPDPSAVLNHEPVQDRPQPGVTTMGPDGRIVMTTSGSTGAPHPVEHAWSACRTSAAAVNKRVAFGPDDVWAWTLRPHHVGGLGIPIRCAEAGGTLFIPTQTNDADTSPMGLEVATHLSLVEVQLARLVVAHRVAPDKWKSIMVGGGAVAPHLLEDAVQKGFPVRTTYGMTETASTVTCSDVWTIADGGGHLKNPHEQTDRSMAGRIHSGTPLDGYDVRVVPDEGATEAGLTEGQEGRIQVKTPFADWISTSDKGVLGPGGRLVVSGRLDRTLISGGENVPLEAIEKALERLPGVQRARVVGVPHAKWGERPVAFVVADVVDEAALRNALTAELPGFMIPDRFYTEPPVPDGQMKWTLAGLTAWAIAHDKKPTA